MLMLEVLNADAIGGETTIQPRMPRPQEAGLALANSYEE
jgi:hypothetical protein